MAAKSLSGISFFCAIADRLKAPVRQWWKGLCLTVTPASDSLSVLPDSLASPWALPALGV